MGNYLRPKLSGSQLGIRLSELPSGTYYWSVQAIDTGLKISAWTAAVTFTVDSHDSGDVNNDGVINITDVILILRKAIGLDQKKR